MLTATKPLCVFKETHKKANNNNNNNNRVMRGLRFHSGVAKDTSFLERYFTYSCKLLPTFRKILDLHSQTVKEKALFFNCLPHLKIPQDSTLQYKGI